MCGLMSQKQKHKPYADRESASKKPKGGGKKKGEHGPDAAEKSNPFEVQANMRGSTKHEVLNRRVKGANRDVSKARAAAIERRHQSIAPQMAAAQKANTFTDRRFGERDD